MVVQPGTQTSLSLPFFSKAPLANRFLCSWRWWPALALPARTAAAAATRVAFILARRSENLLFTSRCLWGFRRGKECPLNEGSGGVGRRKERRKRKDFQC